MGGVGVCVVGGGGQVSREVTFRPRMEKWKEWIASHIVFSVRHVHVCLVVVVVVVHENSLWISYCHTLLQLAFGIYYICISIPLLFSGRKGWGLGLTRLLPTAFSDLYVWLLWATQWYLPPPPTPTFACFKNFGSFRWWRGGGQKARG